MLDFFRNHQRLMMFMLVLVILPGLLVFGTLSDVAGRRALVLAGLAAFAAGTWVGAHHPYQARVAWWQQWWAPEQVDTQPAIEPDWRPDLLLEELAKGAADAALTVEAKASLERLNRRRAAP